MKNVVKLSEQELKNTSKSSWHDQYKDSAWIFIGGLPYDLTEGDIICIFSQYGEILNINLIREKDTGKSKGFCFLCYEDQRSTILAVDNFNGIKILKRTIRVDHVQDYKVPKEGKKTDEETKKLYAEGCAPQSVPVAPITEYPKQDIRETLADQIEGDIRLPARLPICPNIKDEKISDEAERKIKKEKKKRKKDKKKKSKKKKSKKTESSNDETGFSDSESERNRVKFKSDKVDTTLSSDERDRSKRDKREQNDREKQNDSKNQEDSVGSSKSYKTDRHTLSSRRDEKSSSKKSERSRSRDRMDKPRSYKKDVSPNIPKRWR